MERGTKVFVLKEVMKEIDKFSVGYVDLDFAGYFDKRRSTTGCEIPHRPTDRG